MNPADQDLLDYGDEAVERPIDSVLDDSVTTVPLKKGKSRKKKKKKRSNGKLVVITANGYKGFNSVKKEIEALKSDIWLPSTVDFNKTAAHTRNKVHRAASNADEFFGALESVQGRISRIVFVGHGFVGGLGLSGDILDFFGETLESNDIDRWQANINTTIKPKLLKNARVDLIACNIALDKTFLREFANAFGVCVRAFSEEVLWCTAFNENDQEISSRGLIGPKSVVKGKSCSDAAWSKGVNNFAPPQKEEICP